VSRAALAHRSRICVGSLQIDCPMDAPKQVDACRNAAGWRVRFVLAISHSVTAQRTFWFPSPFLDERRTAMCRRHLKLVRTIRVGSRPTKDMKVLDRHVAMLTASAKLSFNLDATVEGSYLSPSDKDGRGAAARLAFATGASRRRIAAWRPL